MKPTFLCAIVLLFFLPAVRAQWLEVTAAGVPPYDVPVNLIRDHLTGPGIEILNVEFDGVPEAVGYFTGGDSTVGLHRGLLLTSGRAATMGTSLGAEEIGSTFASTQNITFPSIEPDLAAQTTDVLYDLARYKITFRASGDSIRFRYVFASEEYPEYGCSAFNDVFGFFLQGPGYPTPVNIARVPGTNLPVTINNVHPANPNNGMCPPKYEQFYHDNNVSSNQPVYDGYLDIFTAEAAVQPCEIYTMTLAIADVSDGVYDSGVFLEAKSFGSVADITASFAPGSAILPENAVADTVRITFSGVPASLLPLTISLGGTAQNGVDYQPLDSVITVNSTDTVVNFLVQPIADSLAESFETVDLVVHSADCFSRTFTLYVSDPDPFFQPTENLTLAAGQTIELTAPAVTAWSQDSWTFSSDTLLAIPPNGGVLYSDLEVVAHRGPGDLPPLPLSDISFLESVCLNIEHPWIEDVDIFLIAPNGRFMELTTDNGGNGDNYTNTCFSPAATQSITQGMVFAPASAAPFTGSFQPEGDWNDLLNTPVIGTWRLHLRDDAANINGQLLNWSITFSGLQLGNFQYQWNTGETTPTIEVSTPGVYSVIISNAVGSVKKTFFVTNECAVQAESAATICAGQTYTFGGEVLSTAGQYTQLHAGPDGCDTLATLHLAVLPPQTDTLLVAVPTGQSFTYQGQTLTQAGTYPFILPGANGCDSTVWVILTFTTATGEPEDATSVLFSPNPASGETVVSWSNHQVFQRLRVFDGYGRLVVSQNIASEKYRLQTAGWASGWYTVEVEDRHGRRAQGRLLVKN